MRRNGSSRSKNKSSLLSNLDSSSTCLIWSCNRSVSVLSFSRGLGKSFPTWLLMLTLIIPSTLGFADPETDEHHVYKRSFFDINCKGVYDKTKFARLDRVCADCYNLFREPQLESLCRKECFTSDFFKGCIDVLLIEGEELDNIKNYVKQTRGADPPF